MNPEKISDKTIKSDPTKSSVISFDSGKFKNRELDEPNCIETATDDFGRRFKALKSPTSLETFLTDGPDQMFLVRMIKGIIPVSDVVFVTNKKGSGSFYSREMPLDDIEDDSERSYGRDNVIVDMFILNMIFHDGDHEINPRNWNMLSKESHFAFFDFDSFAKIW
jgi:hypothetical protein